MAAIKERIVKEDEVVSQPVRMLGKYRNNLVREAKEKGISLSAQLALVLSQHYDEAKQA